MTLIRTAFFHLLLLSPFFSQAQSCFTDCASDELVPVIVQTSTENGKVEALKCLVPTEERLEPMEIELSGEGEYILAFSICEDARDEMLNTTGIVNVEDDQMIYVDDGYN